jgi:hypothetical protein
MDGPENQMLKRASIVAACLGALFLWSAATAADDITRDQLIDAVVGLSKCSGDHEGCEGYLAALPKHFRNGDDLFVEYAVWVPVGSTYRKAPLRRAVMMYRDKRFDDPWGETWSLHFQIDRYRSGSYRSFPIFLLCQPSTIQQLRCRGTEGIPFAESAGGIRTFEFALERP